MTTPDLIEELAWLMSCGESPWQAARQVGMQPRTIVRRIERAQIPGGWELVASRLLQEFRQITNGARAAASNPRRGSCDGSLAVHGG